MLHRAFELRGAIQSFQCRLLSFRDHEAGYSVKKVRVTDNDWDKVLQHLKLLVELVDATKHLEGNGDEKDYAVIRVVLWEVFPWLSIMAMQIDKVLFTMPDELELEPSYFKESLKFGKKKTQLLLGNYDGRHSLLPCGRSFTSKFATCMVPRPSEK